jgi:type I restriction enzyme S subunit
LNRTLEDIVRAVFRAWFVDFEPVRGKAAGATSFRGMPQDLFDSLPVQFQQSEVGEIPKGWTTESLIEQADWINGAAYKNMHFSKELDALPVVKIAELKKGISTNTQSTNTDLGDKYRIATGDLMFSWSGSPETSIDAFVWALGNAWLNQHIFVVRSNGKKNLGYLFALLKHLKPKLIEIAKNKQTTGLGHVTREDMTRLQVCEPNEPLLTWFSAFAQAIYDRILSNLVEVETLSKLRDTLLPKLISGELEAPSLEALGLKAVSDGG